MLAIILATRNEMRTQCCKCRPIQLYLASGTLGAEAVWALSHVIGLRLSGFICRQSTAQTEGRFTPKLNDEDSV